MIAHSIPFMDTHFLPCNLGIHITWRVPHTSCRWQAWNFSGFQEISWFQWILCPMLLILRMFWDVFVHFYTFSENVVNKINLQACDGTQQHQSTTCLFNLCSTDDVEKKTSDLKLKPDGSRQTMNIKAIVRDLLISAPIYILLNKFSTVYIYR